MDTVTKKITSGLEDYLEAIYIAEENDISFKGADLARELNVSRASVSEILAKLVDKKLINYTSYGVITLTKNGREEAEKVYFKHRTLKEFFEKVLFISSNEASENACKIEHIISKNVINKIIEFNQFCKDNPKIIEKFKKETNKESCQEFHQSGNI